MVQLNIKLLTFLRYFLFVTVHVCNPAYVNRVNDKLYWTIRICYKFDL